MKNKIFFLMCILSLGLLSACVPADPAVLSEADLIMKKRAKMPFDEKERTGQVTIPQRVEVALGVLIEARHDQVGELIKLAQGLSQAEVRPAEAPCLGVTSLEQMSSKRSYRLEYKDCKLSIGKQQYSLSGQGQLVLDFGEDGSLVKISYETLADGSRNSPALRILVEGEAVASIEDQLSFELSLLRPGVYSLQKFSAESLLKVSQGSSVVEYQLPMVVASASYEVTSSGTLLADYKSVIRATARQGEFAAVEFQLEVDKRADSAKMQYTKTFGKGRPSTGELEMKDDSVVLLPAKGASKIIDRKKITDAYGAILPWSFWF